MNIKEIIAPIIPAGARSGRQRTGMVGVTIHNTGNYNKGAGAENHGKYLQNSGKDIQASWHYAVDDKCCVLCIPENEVSWHAGDGKGNGNYKTISIEICVNPDSNLLKATDNAAELAANILKRYGLTADNLYQHNHWSGKNCPAEIRKGNPYDWETFKAKVETYLKPPTVIAPLNFAQATAKYYEMYPDVKAAGVDAWLHFCQYGKREGRQWLGEQGNMTEYLTVSTSISPLWLNQGWNGSYPTKKVIKMPKGSLVELIERSNASWFKVKYNGVVGWASSEYLK